MATPITVHIYKEAISYTAAGLPEYQGWAAPGSAKSAAVWRIKKIIYDANNRVTDVVWADGNKEFDKKWTERATSYTYS